MKGLKKAMALLCAVAMTGSLLTVSAFGAQDNTIRLQVNGAYVAMTDAAPEAKGGRTFVPVRAAFEALGADVSWSPSAKTVTAVRGDTTVTMALGSTKATVTENGETYPLEMDAAPYAKGGRTYVPVRFAAQAFSCAVGWDSSDRTVIIVDPDALLGEATFDRLDGWLAASLKEETMDNARTTGTAQFKLTTAGADGKKQTYPLKLDFTSHAAETKQQLTVETNFSDLAGLLVGTDFSAADRAELLRLCKAALDARMDLATGKVYLNIECPLLQEISEGAMGSDQLWYLLDMNELMEQAGGPAWSEYMASAAALPAMMANGDTGFREMLVMILSSYELNDAEYDYEMLALMARVYCALLSDQTMVKSGSDYVVDWSYSESGTTMQMKMTYQTSGERLVGFVMDLSAKDSAGDAMTMNMKVRDDRGNTSMSFRCDLFGELAVEFDLTAKTVQATGEPPVEPPAGAEIVSFFDIGVAPLPEQGTTAPDAA